MGYIWKALERGFSEMYGLGVGSGTIFFRKVAVMVDDLGFSSPASSLTAENGQNFNQNQRLLNLLSPHDRKPSAMNSPP